MATLQIKNKYEVTFNKLIKESRADNGIPDYIEVNGREAWDILNEIGRVGSDAWVINPTDEYDPKFVINANKGSVIPFDTAEELVTKWWKKEFAVIFKIQKDDIPIIVVADTKKDTAKSMETRAKPTKPEPEGEIPDNVEPLKKPEKDDNDDEI